MVKRRCSEACAEGGLASRACSVSVETLSFAGRNQSLVQGLLDGPCDERLVQFLGQRQCALEEVSDNGDFALKLLHQRLPTKSERNGINSNVLDIRDKLRGFERRRIYRVSTACVTLTAGMAAAAAG
jgi:hypothetical protein